MTKRSIDLSGVSLADGTLITTSNVGDLNTAIAPQPTTGNRWTWNASTHQMQRTLDATAGYVRTEDNDGGQFGGLLRRFYWPGGSDPSSIRTLCQIRTTAGTLIAASTVNTSGAVMLNYGTGATFGNVAYDLTGQPAGFYYAETLVKSDAVTGYVIVNVYDTSFNLLGTATNTGLALDGGSPGQFRVSYMVNSITGWTIDQIGGILAWGNLAEGQTLVPTFAAPTGLTATPASTSQIDLDCNDVPTATDYEFRRDGTVSIPSATSSASDTGLGAGTTHDYDVRAWRTIS